LKNFEAELRVGTKENPATQVFSKTDDGNKRWDDFKARVVEHVSEYDENKKSNEYQLSAYFHRICVLWPNTILVFERNVWPIYLI